jgi:hypothetical protein
MLRTGPSSDQGRGPLQNRAAQIRVGVPCKTGLLRSGLCSEGCHAEIETLYRFFTCMMMEIFLYVLCFYICVYNNIYVIPEGVAHKM